MNVPSSARQQVVLRSTAILLATASITASGSVEAYSARAKRSLASSSSSIRPSKSHPACHASA